MGAKSRRDHQAQRGRAGDVSHTLRQPLGRITNKIRAEFILSFNFTIELESLLLLCPRHCSNCSIKINSYKDEKAYMSSEDVRTLVTTGKYLIIILGTLKENTSASFV